MKVGDALYKKLLRRYYELRGCDTLTERKLRAIIGARLERAEMEAALRYAGG